MSIVVFLLSRALVMGVFLAFGLLVFQRLAGMESYGEGAAKAGKGLTLLIGLAGLVGLGEAFLLAAEAPGTGPSGVYTVLIGPYGLGAVALLLSTGPVGMALERYGRTVRRPLRELEVELDESESDYREFSSRIGSPEWTAEIWEFVRYAEKRTPALDSRRLRTVQARLKRLEESVPIAVVEARIREALRTGALQSARKHLKQWRSMWRDTLAVVERLGQQEASSPSRSWSRSRKTPIGSSDTVTLTDRELARLVDLVEIYPVGERSFRWSEAKTLQDQGEWRTMRERLLEEMPHWREEWVRLDSQMSRDFLLLSLETRSFGDLGDALSGVKERSLRTEVFQMMGYEARSEIPREAIEGLREDGVSGRRRTAFILFRRNAGSSRTEAVQMLNDDIEARHWLSQSVISGPFEDRTATTRNDQSELNKRK